jgi:hypothetical protein
MSSVTFSTTVGGDGSTVTDDDDATTGLRNGGWRTRFVPALAQEVAVAANAVASATAALSSKNAAAASASTATTQASNASTSATNASNSATAAAASYDSFDDRYLGVKTSDPSVDNDGNALLVGALYWNSATSVFKVWSGSAWITNLTSNQFGTNVATFLQTPSSANLAAALTDKTGTAGKVVFDTNPTFPAQINLTANSGYNIYASGTADNYLAGSLGIGGLAPAGTTIGIYKNISGAADAYGVVSSGQVQSSVTNSYSSFYSNAYTQATTFTLSNLYGFQATQASIGAGNTVTSQFGFVATSALTGAVNNYGFYGGIDASAGTTRYNLYMAGTADNYLAGSLGIGTSSPDVSAILDAQSTTKGVRFPNMTTTQKNAVSSPAAGLVVFDTTLSKLCVYTGAAWQTITSI